MRLLRFASGRAAVVILYLGALGFAVSGCASKNPLMEDAAATAPGASASHATTEPDNDTAQKTDNPDHADTAGGVQIVQHKRFLGFLSPYRVDVQQGNFISEEMLAQLKPGMTEAQVRFALGTPLLNDIFHADRWDYLFRMQKRNGEITTSRVTVFFKDKKMVRYEGGNLPTEQEYLARIAGTPAKDNPKEAGPAASKAPSAAARQ